MAQSLLNGEVVAFPTDTVYGLGAYAFLPEAVALLYTLKKRPLHLPIPLLLPDKDAVSTLCTSIPPVAWRLADAFWPGGLSLILRRSPAVPDIVSAGGPTVAVRVPDHELVRELCRRLGGPLAATSANGHGQPPPVTADEVEAGLPGGVHYILDGGPCPGGIASTVLDLTQSPPRILRRGPVTGDQLSALVSLAQ
ncbi:L-threonylcarbamoyladenylate synthase [Chloroflexota bacterium]